MSQNLDEFKRFVKNHPGLNTLISSKVKTWQDIFEEWTFFKDDDRWNTYLDPDVKEVIIENSTSTSESIKESVVKKEGLDFKNMSSEDMMKTALAYVKKINPDTITKTVSNAQKLLALVSGLGIGTSAGIAKNSKTGDPLFDKRFDEWY